MFNTNLKLIIKCLLQEFKTSGSSNTDTSKVVGSLETKYKRSEYGLTFTEKWNTDNTLGTEITIEDQVRISAVTKVASGFHADISRWHPFLRLTPDPIYFLFSFKQIAKGLKLTFDTTFSPNTG